VITYHQFMTSLCLIKEDLKPNLSLEAPNHFFHIRSLTIFVGKKTHKSNK